MAEGKESGGKAADVFIGVVDMFSIILPGALLALVLWMVINNNIPHRITQLQIPEFVPPWLLFLICSYVLGHFVAALGSWIMDYLYDGYFKHRFEFYKKKELPSLRRRADRLIANALGAGLYSEVDNRLTWGESFLLLRNPIGTAKLDRLEADSKFFRSLAALAILTQLVCFSPLTSWAPFPQYWPRALVGALVLASLVYLSRWEPRGRPDLSRRVKQRLEAAKKHPVAGSTRRRLDWLDDDWLEAEKAEREVDMQRIRWWALLLPIAWLVYVVSMALIADDCAGWVVAGICWVLTVMSAWRFMDLRSKRLALGYYLTIALHKAAAFGGTESKESA